MKKTLLALVLAAASFSAARAQQAPAPVAATAAAPAAPAGYDELLGQTIEAIMNTGSATELGELAATMERAAAANPTNWLPRYYQAYALIIDSFVSQANGDAKDKLLDQAEAAIGQARQLKGDESELLALQAYLYQARLRVSPMLRSGRYSALAMEAVGAAKALNPANPRPYLVAANNVYYTPAMFGGGAEKARPLYEEARAKYAAFRPAGPLAPSWGESQVLGRLKGYEAPAAAARGN